MWASLHAFAGAAGGRSVTDVRLSLSWWSTGRRVDGSIEWPVIITSDCPVRVSNEAGGAKDEGWRVGREVEGRW